MRTSLVLVALFMFSLMVPLASTETNSSESSQDSNSGTYLIDDFDFGVVYDFLDHSRKICEQSYLSQFPERFFIEADGFFYFWTEYYIENENGDDDLEHPYVVVNRRSILHHRQGNTAAEV